VYAHLNREKGDPMVDFSNRADESHVARILSLIAHAPNRRGTPREDDPVGDFEFWFDGGACMGATGSQHYTFTDGTTATVAFPATWLWVSIQFSDGRIVDIIQRRQEVERPRQEIKNVISATSGEESTISPLERPLVWHCIFCGWKCNESYNNYLCKQCGQLRPFVDESATRIQCSECQQWNLVVAAFCEWCGKKLSG
jgi:hypothetical protein